MLTALGAAVAVAGTPAAASASAGDAAATQAYVQANYALVRVVRSHLATSEAGPVRVLHRVSQECPRAGAGSPQDPESTQMSDDVIGAMVISAAQPDLQAIKAFVRSVSGLSWSNRGLTNAVRSYARKVNTIFSLVTPDLCADVKAWAALGYHSLPPNVSTFVNRFMPAWVAIGYLPKQLRGFESGADASLAHRGEPLETLITEAETRAVEHYRELMNALEIWP